MNEPAAPTTKQVSDPQTIDLRAEIGGERMLAAGGILGALAASSCCILPLVLFSLGAGGSWLGNLSALSPYQPYFIAITLVFVGSGFYLVRRRQKIECEEDEACARPLPRRTVKAALWAAAVIVAAAIAFPYVAPTLLGV